MPRTSRRNEYGERYCNGCGEYKPETDQFWNRIASRPGQFNSPCKDCQREMMAQRVKGKK
jgi:hypothetical protein